MAARLAYFIGGVALVAVTAQDARLASPHDLDHPHAFTQKFETREDWLARRTALARQVLVAVGLWPLPPRTPLAPVVHGRIDRDGYTIEKVFFASLPGHYVSGNLYRPTGRTGKRPAVLTAHGHWENGRLFQRPDKAAQALIDQGAERTLDAARYPHQARSASLARLGFVVFQYDMVGYGDSKALVHREGFADADALLRLQSNMGLQTWNSIRALDFVTSLPDVDASRVAVTGESGGGTQTLLLSAVDERIQAAFPSVMVSGAMQGGCVCENAPLLRVGTNNIELAALIAPKPLAMSAANDWTHDLLTVGLPELKSIFGLFGAADRVTARFMPFEHGDHLPSRELMYSWFSRYLLGNAQTDAIVESSFIPVPPSELSVFDTAHPRAAEADAPGVRSYLTRTSDEQMAALAADPARYREVVSTALRAMVNDPFASGVEALTAPAESGRGSSLAGAGIAVSHARLMRSGGGGEVVPVMTLTPRGWKGGPIVIWTHPAGQASLFAGSDSAGVVPAARSILDRGAMIIAPDVFLTGASRTSEGAARLSHVKDEERLPAYNYGYNRAVLAERVRDLFTTVAFAEKQHPRAIQLIAFDRAGVWALLTRALAGESIARASIDLDGFEFAAVRDPFDPMMLPGAVKYGGIAGLLPLMTSGQTELYRLSSPPRSSPGPAPRPATLSVRSGPPDAERMARWLMGS
jgi:dienelactone hydrolase